jgi:hypothetical protein
MVRDCLRCGLELQIWAVNGAGVCVGSANAATIEELEAKNAEPKALLDERDPV